MKLLLPLISILITNIKQTGSSINPRTGVIVLNIAQNLRAYQFLRLYMDVYNFNYFFNVPLQHYTVAA
jgi:hypothetical protein